MFVTDTSLHVTQQIMQLLEFTWRLCNRYRTRFSFQSVLLQPLEAALVRTNYTTVRGEDTFEEKNAYRYLTYTTIIGISFDKKKAESTNSMIKHVNYTH